MPTTDSWMYLIISMHLDDRGHCPGLSCSTAISELSAVYMNTQFQINRLNWSELQADSSSIEHNNLLQCSHSPTVHIYTQANYFTYTTCVCTLNYDQDGWIDIFGQDAGHERVSHCPSTVCEASECAKFINFPNKGTSRMSIRDLNTITQRNDNIK